jgi:aspartyl-tRNA(Asn)/glutamyl-tRNA(Gln) amidotransferase subunit A
MKTLAFATISEIQEQIALKKISSQEVLDFFIRRFEVHDDAIGSALEIFDKKSIINASQVHGRLAGIPGIIKDNICQKDRITSCASKMLADYKPTYDATAITRLKNDGAYMIGRANCDEFAMGSSTETSAFKKTKNPWDLTRVPGGSSGGSVAAVAAGLVPWALGSETGGSVRLPAAFCGVVGLKPTYGLVSRYGLVAYGSSLDQIGVCTRTVQDCALVLSSITGQDINDSSTLPVVPQDYTKMLDGKLPESVRIGIVDNFLQTEGIHEDIAAAIDNTIALFSTMGAHVKRVSLPSLEYSAAAYFIISRAEAASNLARFDGVRYGMRDKKARSIADMYANTRHDGFGDEVKLRILIGNYVLSAGHAGDFYVNAQKVRQQIRAQFLQTFQDVDVLLMPMHPMPAFPLGTFDLDKLQLDLLDYFTCPVNLAGIPAISLPCGFTRNNLPIGFQLVGPHLSEALLLKVADAYEKQTSWHLQHPQGF